MLYENLSEKDKAITAEYINEHGQYLDGQVPEDKMVSLSERLRFWDSNKLVLYHLLGDKFIIKRPISDIIDIETICKRIDACLGDFYTSDADMNICLKFKENLLKHLSPYNRYLWAVHDLFNPHNLANNIYAQRDRTDVTMPNGDIVRWKQGEKTLRILRKLVKSIDDPDLTQQYEEFRIWHSQMLNDNKLSGNLCLSILPIDFFTMSDNTYHWSSCMDWTDDGEYHLGTIECMNSSYILVTYLEGHKPMPIGDYEWEGNKKWRTLVAVHQDFCATIKGYPYQHPELAQLVLKWVRELAIENLHYQYRENVITNNRTAVYLTNTFAIEPVFYNMYNDFGSCESYYYISEKLYKQAQNYQETNIHVASYPLYNETNCMCCGRTQNLVSIDADCVFCADCAQQYVKYCPLCGERIYVDDDYYDVEDQTICADCYESSATYDPFYDEYIFISNSITLEIDYMDEDTPNEFIEIHEGNIQNHLFEDTDYFLEPPVYNSAKNKYVIDSNFATDLLKRIVREYGYINYR